MNATELRLPSYSAAQTRVMDTALDLFSQHGVSGTSLQMIADAIGVTKAAVYHQFRTKEEIVIAAAGLIVTRLEEVVKTAAVERSRAKVRKAVIDGLIELAVVRRQSASFLQRDPVMLRIFEEYEPFRQVMERLHGLLMGNNTRPGAQITVALLVTAIGGTVIHPLVTDIDNEILGARLKELAHSLVGFLD